MVRSLVLRELVSYIAVGFFFNHDDTIYYKILHVLDFKPTWNEFHSRKLVNSGAGD
jgi:hypothetical protein